MPARADLLLLLQGVLNQPLLLFGVPLRRTGRRAGVLRPAGIVDHAAESLEVAEHEAPRAHIAGLFLAPDEIGAGAVAGQHVEDALLGERAKLLDAHERDIVDLL